MAPGTAKAERPRRVLVVDDNVDVTDTLTEVLEMIGHETRDAHDGPTALAIAQEFRPDVVLLDIGLPEMSGYEVAQRLRAQPGGKELMIVALTWGQQADLARTSESGFDHHLVKPAGLEALRELIGDARGRRESPDRN